MEASGHARWFERLLAEVNFELWIGDASEIARKRERKQKTDRQDAQQPFPASRFGGVRCCDACSCRARTSSLQYVKIREDGVTAAMAQMEAEIRRAAERRN